jgi:L-gulonolactone oxidase
VKGLRSLGLRRDRDAWENWSRTASCDPAAVEEPDSERAVVEAVRRASAAGQTVKVVGAGHSFNDIACTNGLQLRLDRLNRVLAVDVEAGVVTVQAGIRLWELIEQLATRGLALPVLGDIDRQSIAGAIATGTHGSSRCHGSLATLVAGLELVIADGSVLRCSRNEEPEAFDCARVGLGALGVVTKLILRVEPAFRLEAIEAPRPIDEVIDTLDEIAEANEYVNCYWFPQHRPCQRLCGQSDPAGAPPGVCLEAVAG